MRKKIVGFLAACLALVTVGSFAACVGDNERDNSSSIPWLTSGWTSSFGEIHSSIVNGGMESSSNEDSSTSQEHIHEYEESEIEATCLEEGYIVYTCACGAEKKDPIAALGHNYSDWFSFYVAELGEEVYTRCCLRCGVVEYKLLDWETPKLPEDFDDWIKDPDNGIITPINCIHKNIVALKGYPPTCMRTGIDYQIQCVDCHVIIYTKWVNALGHAWGEEQQVSPCITKKICQRCGEIQETVNHNLVDGEGEEPTCTEDGYTLKECTKCDYEKKTELSALGHNWRVIERKEATCIEDGYKISECLRCGERKNEPLIDSGLSGHVGWEKIEEQDSTCVNSGWIKWKCTACGYVHTEWKNALGHTWGNILDQKEPTCTEAGWILYGCTRCEETNLVDKNALGHNWKITYDDHTHTGECRRCGAKETELHSLYVDMEQTSEDMDTFVRYTTVFYYKCSGFVGACGFKKEITRAYFDVPKGDTLPEYKYNVTDPTCTEEGLFILLNEETGEEISRAVIPALGHCWDYDGICIRCGKRQGTEGLKYTLSGDKTYYIVSGIGTATDTDIVIPPIYNGLPVKEIGARAFQHGWILTSIEIPDSVTSIRDRAFV